MGAPRGCPDKRTNKMKHLFTTLAAALVLTGSALAETGDHLRNPYTYPPGRRH